MTRPIDWTDIDPLLGHENNHTISRKFGIAVRTIRNRRRVLGLQDRKYTIRDEGYCKELAPLIAVYPRPDGLGEFLVELQRG